MRLMRAAAFAAGLLAAPAVMAETDARATDARANALYVAAVADILAAEGIPPIGESSLRARADLLARAVAALDRIVAEEPGSARAVEIMRGRLEAAGLDLEGARAEAMVLAARLDAIRTVREAVPMNPAPHRRIAAVLDRISTALGRRLAREGADALAFLPEELGLAADESRRLVTAGLSALPEGTPEDQLTANLFVLVLAGQEGLARDSLRAVGAAETDIEVLLAQERAWIDDAVELIDGIAAERGELCDGAGAVRVPLSEATRSAICAADTVAFAAAIAAQDPSEAMVAVPFGALMMSPVMETATLAEVLAAVPVGADFPPGFAGDDLVDLAQRLMFLSLDRLAEALAR